MKSLWKQQKGTTLVEVAAGMVIAMMLMAAVTGIYIFSGNLFRKYAENRELSDTVNCVSDFVCQKILYAEDLELCREQKTTADTDHVIGFSKDGRVYFDGEAVFAEAFYNRMKIFCSIKSAGQDVLEYSIELKNQKNEPLYSTRTVIKLINLEINGRQIQGFEAKEGKLNQSEVYIYYNSEE